MLMLLVTGRHFEKHCHRLTCKLRKPKEVQELPGLQIVFGLGQEPMLHLQPGLSCHDTLLNLVSHGLAFVRLCLEYRPHLMIIISND